MLTFETDSDGVLEVNFDAPGRELLLEVIQRLAPGDHEHISTESWGGWHLTEDFPNPDLSPIHKATFSFRE